MELDSCSICNDAGEREDEYVGHSDKFVYSDGVVLALVYHVHPDYSWINCRKGEFFSLCPAPLSRLSNREYPRMKCGKFDS